MIKLKLINTQIPHKHFTISKGPIRKNKYNISKNQASSLTYSIKDIISLARVNSQTTRSIQKSKYAYIKVLILPTPVNLSSRKIFGLQIVELIKDKKRRTYFSQGVKVSIYFLHPKKEYTSSNLMKGRLIKKARRKP